MAAHFRTDAPVRVRALQKAHYAVNLNVDIERRANGHRLTILDAFDKAKVGLAAGLPCDETLPWLLRNDGCIR